MKQWNRRDAMKAAALALGVSAAGGLREQAYAGPSENTGAPGRWSVERAKKWQSKFPWIMGCNYVPSTAVNQLEMWQAETFDPKTIDRELGMAESIGLNTVRVFLHDLAWRQDKAGFKQRYAEFNSICKKHNIWTIPTFFTNGGPGTPIKIGKQPDPEPGVHNSKWLQSPGSDVTKHPETWGYLEEYVTDMLSTFANDDRVYVWCLYNEPECIRNGNYSLPLMRELWKWGRKVNPSQPFTGPVTVFPTVSNAYSNFPICCFLGENCDLMSFHAYVKPADVEKIALLMQQFGRPVVCTEYLSRPTNNFFNVTPLFKKRGIGAIHFGLVNGKCNFQFHNGHPDLPEPKFWKHDLFRKDGSSYDPKEIEFIKKLTGKVS